MIVKVLEVIYACLSTAPGRAGPHSERMPLTRRCRTHNVANKSAVAYRVIQTRQDIFEQGSRMPTGKQLRISSLAPVFAFAGCISSAAAAEITLPPLPKPPASDRVSAFPECKPEQKELIQLRRCRSELEAYREGVLEGYNKRIARYIQALKRADAELEAARAKRQVSAATYEARHQEIANALEAAGPGGELLDISGENMIRYRELSRWLNESITALERERIRPR